MIKAVVFDLGGVLFERTVPRTMIKVSQDYGLDNDKVKEFFDIHYVRAMRNELAEEEFFDMLIKEFNLPLDHEFFYENIVRKALPIRGTWEIVKKLRGKYRLGVISDLTSGWREYKETHNPLLEIFDVIIYSYKVGMTKPDEKIFREYLKKSGLKADECVFIDDKEENIAGAEMLGFNVILFDSSDQCERELKKYVKL